MKKPDIKSSIKLYLVDVVFSKFEKAIGKKLVGYLKYFIKAKSFPKILT